ncbi:MAG: hypothetical protein AAB649_07065 [Patescibacteria group bacterium]
MFTKSTSLSTDLSTSIPQERSIFAIFVHYGPQEITDAAVASLLEGTLCPEYIIVIDHTETVIPAREPESRKATWVRPGVNTGYAGGLQYGIAEAARLGAKKTDICLLLNNDLKLKKDSLQQIVAWWTVNGGPKVLAGAAGGYVSLFSGRAHIVGKMPRKTFWNTPYVHGSCMVGQFGLLSSTQFPTSFFMYWEDVAISMQVQKHGGHLNVIPGLQNIHNDTKGPISPAKLFYMVRNGAYVVERYVSLPWRMYWYAVNTIRMLYHAISRHRIIARALVAARRGRLGRVNL